MQSSIFLSIFELFKEIILASLIFFFDPQKVFLSFWVIIMTAKHWHLAVNAELLFVAGLQSME